MVGILCDGCGLRIPAVRIEADMEIRGRVVRADLELCEVCIKSPDFRVIELHHANKIPSPVETKADG